MRKLILLVSFFAFAPGLLLFSLFLLIYMSVQKDNAYLSAYALFGTQKQTISYAALPTVQNAFQTSIDAQDTRVEKIRELLSSYHSPLADYAQIIVTDADAYGIPYNIVPAIALQESKGCERIMEDSHNCWGYDIYGTTHRHVFSSYEEAINTETKTLATDYFQKGLKTPDQIMTKYTPSSLGSWAQGVTYFLQQM